MTRADTAVVTKEQTNTEVLGLLMKRVMLLPDSSIARLADIAWGMQMMQSRDNDHTA